MTKKLEYWLFMVALGHVVSGLALPVFAYSSGFDLYALRIRETFWAGAPIPPEADAFQRWIIALIGPTIAAWGVLMAYLVRAGMNTADRWPWNALLVSVLAWAPADMAISLMHRFWFNVIIDLVVITIIVVPVILIRRDRSGS